MRSPATALPAGAGQPVRGLPSGPRYSSSLDYGLAIMACFTAEYPVQGISDVVKRLGFGRSTTHRYMSTLLALGYLEQVGKDSRYRLAPRAADVGRAAIDALPVCRHSHTILEQLHEQTGYTASLGVLDGDEVLYVDRARTSRLGQREIDLGVPPGLRVGWRLPAHCCAMGKLLLAYLPEPDRRERVGRLELTRHGPHAITSRTVLRGELDRICTRGLAVSGQELAEGLLSIAAPVRDTLDTVIAALCLEAHTSMTSLGDLVSELSRSLIYAASGLSARLGCGLVEDRLEDGG